MSDSSMENLKAFEERIKRIEGGNRKAGRVGRKRSGEYFRKEEERRRRGRKGRKANWTLRILLVLVAVLGVKSYIMASMGDAAYEARMTELQAGDKYQKIAFLVMKPDPLSAKLQDVIENAGFMESRSRLRDDAAPATAAATVVPETEEADSTGAEPASRSSNSELAAN